MLTKPALADDTIMAYVRTSYGLSIDQVTFLPLGADASAAVYRLDASDGTPYFLKLRRGAVDETVVAVPTALHAQGISTIVAPLATTTGGLWTRAQAWNWIVYPFVSGRNGWAQPLSPAQWITLGATVKALHSASLPPELIERVPRETYTGHWRDTVRQADATLDQQPAFDQIAVQFVAFWHAERRSIQRIVQRAEQLAAVLAQRVDSFVLCHADLHAGNVLLGANDALWIVDWDTLTRAPKERDLMFVGAGIGDVWRDPAEAELFNQGYGPTSVDPVALSYYRYERIVQDIAAYHAQILDANASVADRAEGLYQLAGQWEAGSVVEIADQTYAHLP